ncbi:MULTISPECIES: hypothetical protein [Paenibacillus]|uniref:hyaluronate lyase N-terminal domain-containing protein n=1 Tax=Paenibacillus TaxID=44249 RepID=UPI00096F05CB|nr:hypothetical protein [Paenibacillus odorifer]OME21594.1 hypothetical protein BSK57_19810 [Paenibacillus odorifer]
MAVIKIKRGLSANVSGLVLEAGELALATDTGKLYAGNGTGRVLLNPDQAAAETAVKLQTPRTIAITGDGAGTSSGFDGSANASISLILANSGVTAGSYTKVTVDAKGRVTAASQMTAADIALGNVTNESKTTMFISPAFTGTPTAPTAAAGTNSTQLATTAFVEAVRVILAAADALKAPLASPAFTGNPTVPTQATADNSTKVASTAFVKSQGYLSASDTIDGGTF